MDNMLLLIGGLGMQEVLVITLVVLLFFGGKKIPELMNGLGKGVRSFKEGLNDIKKDVDEASSVDGKDSVKKDDSAKNDTAKE